MSSWGWIGSLERVGDRVVKGRWKDEFHERGVPGTYGNGYEGVRKAEATGVGRALPLIVFADSVDSVEFVCSGLSKEALRVGESAGLSSSWMDVILRRLPEPAVAGDEGLFNAR
jgi:hypothetical protein